MCAMRRIAKWRVRWVLVFGVGLCWPQLVLGQSPRLQAHWQQLVQQPGLSVAREQLLWHLAAEEELPNYTRDSLAGEATRLARQLGDSTGMLMARVFGSYRSMRAGWHQAAQAPLVAALPIARRQHNTWVECQILLALGRNQWGTTTHDRAQYYWLQAWAVAQRQPDLALQAHCAWLLGTFYTDYATALEWLFRSLRLSEAAADQATQANVLGSIAYNYAQLGDLGQAEAYYQRALRLSQRVGSAPGLCRVLINTSEFYLGQGQAARASRGYQQAARYAATPLDHFNITGGLAEAYTQLGKYALALRYAHQALGLAQQLHDVGGVTTRYGTLAQVFLAAGQLDSARIYGERAYARRPPGSRQPIMREVCRVLAQTYARQGNFTRAYAFQSRYQAYTDTLTSQQIRLRAAQVQARYQREQDVAQALLRTRSRELARLQRRQQVAALLLAGGLLLGTAATALLIYRRRQRRREATLRQQLASDLHDEVGTLLTRVSVQAQLLATRPPSQHPAALAQLLSNSQAAASTLRDVAWGLDTSADSAGSLADRMRDYLTQTVGAAGWSTELHAPDWPDALVLPPAIRQGVYRIFKEAVTNALRHAPSATTLHVELRQAAGQLHLTVLDNGQAAPPALGPTTGLGLRSMRQRAAALGGTLQVGPQAAGGFAVRLAVLLQASSL